ncbi:MAG: hypothetical protein JW384_01910 [Nitrosomonadaceae bacterium]|nr:hypothetical protein [Nitrosomonadaceae bacterium]
MTEFYLERAPKTLDLILCGGHDFNNRERVSRLMDHLNTGHNYVGALRMPAHTGAPLHAAWWAKQHDVEVLYVPAQTRSWRARLQVNHRLLHMCDPKDSVVVLFPGKFVTTQHMFAEAERLGFQVLPVEV